MSEEEKKNHLCEDEEEDEDDDDYEPSEDEAKDSNKSDDSNNEDEENLINCQEEKNEMSNVKKLSEDEKKKRADKLWQDLCSSTSNNCSNSDIKKLDDDKQLNSKQEIIKVTKEYDFAGEKVEVVEEIKKNDTDLNKLNTSSNKRSLGIKSLVANFGKKQKLSTLNKTKLDWDMFKKEEGLEDDLKNHVKNKNSFIERQAFLQRTDLKQFELEKQVREKNRSKN